MDWPELLQRLFLFGITSLVVGVLFVRFLFKTIFSMKTNTFFSRKY